MDNLEGLILASAIILGVLMLCTWAKGPQATAILLGGSAALVTAQVGGMHAFTALVVLYFVLVRNKNSLIGPRIPWLILSAVLVASTGFFGALAVSINPALQLVAMVCCAVLLARSLIPRHGMLALYGFLATTSLSAMAAALQALGWIPAQLFQLEGAEMHRPSGFYPEPDWLGLYCAAAVVVLFSIRISKKLMFALLAINMAGVAFASARAAILALIVVAAISFVRSLNSRRGEDLRVGAVFGILSICLVGLLFWVAQPVAAQLLVTRIATAIDPTARDGAASIRILQTNGLALLADRAPWFGYGLSASGRVTGFGLVDYGVNVSNTNGSNWVVGLWADAKFLSVPLIAVLTYLALFGRKAFCGRNLLLIVLVNSLFSNALLFPITWFAVGLALTTALAPTVKPSSVLETTQLARPARSSLGLRGN